MVKLKEFFYLEGIKINNQSKKVTEYLVAIAVIIAVTVFFIWGQLKNHAAIINNDTIFHYHRFFDLYEQIRTGHFNYFQSNFSFEQAGRMINAVYGPVFAFINALLVALCQTWLRYQIVSDIIISLIGGLGFYQLTRELKVKNWISFILIPLFLATGSMPLWINGTSFMGWSAAMMPWVLVEGIRMVDNDVRPINWVRLTLIISIVAQIHLITTVLAAISLIPFFLVAFFRSSTKFKLILQGLLAAFVTILLSGNVLGGLLILNETPHSLPVPGDLFSNAIGLYDVHALRSRLLPIMLVAVIIQTLLSLIFKGEKGLNLLISLEGSFILYVGSQMFPWKEVQNLLPGLQESFQAPYRLNVIVFPLLIAGFGLTLTLMLNKISPFTSIVSLSFGVLVLMLVLQTSVKFQKLNNLDVENYLDPNIVLSYKSAKRVPKNRVDIRRYFSEKGLNWLPEEISNVMPDYLPKYNSKLDSNEVNTMYFQGILQRQHFFKHSVGEKGGLHITWTSDNNQSLELPIVLYNHSTLTLNGKTIAPKLNDIGIPTVKSNIGRNNAVLNFKTPKWFNGLLILTSFSWVIMFLIYGYEKISKKILLI